MHFPNVKSSFLNSFLAKQLLSSLVSIFRINFLKCFAANQKELHGSLVGCSPPVRKRLTNQCSKFVRITSVNREVRRIKKLYLSERYVQVFVSLRPVAYAGGFLCARSLLSNNTTFISAVICQKSSHAPLIKLWIMTAGCHDSGKPAIGNILRSPKEIQM